MNIPNFHQRLTETISWCTSQEIVSEPTEEASITQRRAMGRQAAQLSSKAYRMLTPYNGASHISRWIARRKIRQANKIREEAEQLMAAADPGSIIPPLRCQLRTEALRSLALPFAQSNADRLSIVEAVVQARARLSRDAGISPEAPSADLSGGRILLYAPDDNLACGAGEYASKGFFDVNNVPPWDTWVCMSQTYLISWVPAQLIRLVQEGIDVNPEQCILWADDPSSKELIAIMPRELTSRVTTS